jgi:hypothetical protein
MKAQTKDDEARLPNDYFGGGSNEQQQMSGLLDAACHSSW